MTPVPRTGAEILADLDHDERRHNGPSERRHLLDEGAARRRWERDSPLALLRADLRRYENVRAEHLKYLRISVRQFRALLRQPDSPQRAVRLVFARDAIEHNKESVRIWTRKVADARAKYAARRWAMAAA